MILPSLDQAIAHAEATDTPFFYKTEEAGGTDWFIFNYGLFSRYSDFLDPPWAKELRGITYNAETGVCFPSIHKFFNYNEGEDQSYRALKDIGIVSVQPKEDGSLIQPIVHHGKIYAKTRGTFRSFQARRAQAIIYHNNRLYNFITGCWDGMLFDGIRCLPLFEYVSPENQVVVHYPTESLRLIQVRAIEGGWYLDPHHVFEEIYIHDFQGDSFIPPQFYSTDAWTLDRLLEDCDTERNSEGWVVRFNTGTFIKMKTRWYQDLHPVLGDDTLPEHRLISMVLNNTIDDVISVLDPSSFKREQIDQIIKTTVNWARTTSEKSYHTLVVDAPVLSRKDFALKYKKDPLFHIMMPCFVAAAAGSPDLEQQIEQSVKTFAEKNFASSLTTARNFLQKNQ